MKNPFEQDILDLIKKIKQEIDVDITMVDDLKTDSKGFYIIPENHVIFDPSFDATRCRIFARGENVEVNKRLHTYIKKTGYKARWIIHSRNRSSLIDFKWKKSKREE